MKSPTPSGIEVLGDISWGTHFSQFYETTQDLLEILVPYFKAGLENKEYCICIVSNNGRLTAEELKKALALDIPDFDQYLAKKAIEIVDETEWYLKDDEFDPARVIDALRSKYKDALLNGYTGMRVSGDTFWLGGNTWKDFNAYEKRVDDFVVGQRMIVLCTYSLDECGGAEMLDVMDAHQYIMVRRKGKWKLIEPAVQIQAEAEVRRLQEEAKPGKALKPGIADELLKYGVAVVSIGVALSILFSLQTLIDNPPYVSVFFCVVIFSTRFGGVRPGVFSIIILAFALDYYFLPPIYSFAVDPPHLPRLVFFLLPSVFIVWLSASQSRLTKSLERAGNVLLKTIQKLKQTNNALQEEISERKQVEASLRKSEDSIRLIIDTIPMMAWSLGTNGIVEFLNQRWMDYSGLTMEQFARDQTAVIHPDDVVKVQEMWQVKMATEEPYELEIRLQRADGVYRWFLVRTAPLYDEHGNVVKWYGVSIDIEDNKQLSAALRESDERYVSLFQNMAEGVAYFHMLFEDGKLQDAVYLQVNSAWERLTGLKDVVGRRLSDVLPGILQSRSEFFERASRVALTGKSERFEAYSPVLGKWLSTSAYCPRKEHVIVVMDDITERKQADEKLESAYQRLSYHVENTPLAVIEFDKDLFVKRWSKRAEEIFGWKASEALGKNVYDPDFSIIYKEDVPAVDTINEELLKGTVHWNLSLNRNYTKDKGVIYCEWYNSVLRDEHDQVITILSLVHDVTNRKKAEEKLQQLNAELHSLSAHLQNVRESERTDIAREIHDELGQQLTGLKLEVGWLTRKLPQVAALKEKGNEILSIVSGMLKTVKRIAMDLRPNILDELGLSAALEWQTQEFEKRTGIQSKLVVGQPGTEPDKKLSTNIFRVYQEALTNIARHANATRVETIFEQDDDQIRLIVKDNGQGFDVNEVKHKDSLGLVGMKERARMFNGDLIIEPNNPRGTIVVLSIPNLSKGQ